MISPFELFAFYSNPDNLREVMDAQIDGIIIDWEQKGKKIRQSLYDTQVNRHSLNDLQIVAAQKPKKIICRVNGPDYWSKDEFQKAIDHGADEILLPMVKNLHEVTTAFKLINGQADISLMLETEESLLMIKALDELSITRVFVGLNDLSIQRNSNNIFAPMFDGTVDKLRPNISKKFGIMGLTHPDAGYPIPCKYLIHVMKGLKCNFGILRRSFYRDMKIYGAKEIIHSIRNTFEKKYDENNIDPQLIKKHFLSFKTSNT